MVAVVHTLRHGSGSADCDDAVLSVEPGRGYMFWNWRGSDTYASWPGNAAGQYYVLYSSNTFAQAGPLCDDGGDKRIPDEDEECAVKYAHRPIFKKGYTLNIKRIVVDDDGNKHPAIDPQCAGLVSTSSGAYYHFPTSGPDGVADYPTVWLTAEPFDNCCSKFQRWEVDELDYHDYNEFQNPLQLRMDRDYTVTAEFGPDAADFGADALIVWGGLITSGASQAQSTLTALGYKCTYREEPGTAGALNLIPCHDIFVFQGHSNGLRLIVGCPGATLKDDGQYSYWTFMLQKLYPDDVASVLNNPYRFVYLHACNPEGVPALEAWRDAFQAEALVGWINPASEGEGEGEGEEGVDFGLLMAFDEAFWEYVQEGWGTWDATYKAMAKANIHDTDLKRPQPIGDVVLKK